jgi:hypothetical protein
LVKAVTNTIWDDEIKTKGKKFRVPTLLFLEQAHHDAWMFGRGSGPIFAATGKGHADLKAGTCCRILSFLGERLNKRRQEGTAAASLNAIAAEITGSKGGKRYAQIKDLAEGLHLLGFIRVQKIGHYHKIGLVRKRVKYLRRGPRRTEALEASPTSA